MGHTGTQKAWDARVKPPIIGENYLWLVGGNTDLLNSLVEPGIPQGDFGNPLL